MAVIQYPYSGAPDYALTGGPQIYQVFTATSQANLVEKICAALLLAYHPAGTSPAYGWTFVSDITRGHRLLVTSPQGYTAYVDVYWYGGMFAQNPIGFKWHSATGSGAVGIEQIFDWQHGTRQYQIVANPASYFLCRPGVVIDIAGSACLAGIPRMDDGCGFGADPITEVWWQFEDKAAGGYFNNWCPRITLGENGGGDGQQGVLNGSVVTGAGDASGSPRLLRLSSAGYDVITSKALWYDGKPALYPAFSAWGDPVRSGLKLRGQLYDAAIRSKPYDMEATDSWDTFDWINYTHQYHFGSLWLIKGETAPAVESIPIVNVAH